MALATILFFCFACVVLFALMAGLTEAATSQQRGGALIAAPVQLEFNPSGRSIEEKWSLGPLSHRILYSQPGDTSSCVYPCPHTTGPKSGRWC